MVHRPANTLRTRTLPALLLAGDALLTFACLSLAWLLRYATSIGALGIDVPDARYGDYVPLLVVGTGLLVISFAHLGLYDPRLVLRRHQAYRIVLKGATFWLAAYLGVSLVLKFDPPISRLFVVLAWALVLAGLQLWRTAVFALVSRPGLRERIRQPVAILGWSPEAAAIAAEVDDAAVHPWRIAGWIDDGASAAPGTLPRLGEASRLEDVLRTHGIEVVLCAGFDALQRGPADVPAVCERVYAEWKVIPTAFSLFASGLRLQTVGRVPVLGVEDLAANRLLNRALKRALDIAGATLGLLLAAPVCAWFAWRIRRESPGPAVFVQQRVGRGHRLFPMLKLRSMRAGTEADDHRSVSTRADDPRLTATGRFIRRWNIDELPQFWNVLRGEMSLVGPRPERPHHVDRLSGDVPHYLPRHVVKPGMTGWAQVNGLRGDTSLPLRVQHDIYYIENWSVWLDVQILLLTLARWRNPSA